MHKLMKAFLAVSFMSFPAYSFTMPTIAPAEEVLTCAKLQTKASDHEEFSSALEDFTTTDELSAKYVNRAAKLALVKIQKDIHSVRDLVGLTEELTVLEQTPSLLRKVKSNSLSTESANALMIDKLNQLDRAMFDSLQEAAQTLTGCRVFGTKAKAESAKKTSAAETVQ